MPASDIQERRVLRIKSLTSLSTLPTSGPRSNFSGVILFYGITFGENTNEMANEDVYEIQYKTRGLLHAGYYEPGVYLSEGEIYKIPNLGDRRVLSSFVV